VTAIRSVVLGCGAYLPKRILTNAELAQRIDTSDEWIVQRTGIRQRHIAAEGEFTSHLAIHAARSALADAGVDAQSIDLIVLATSTPDNTFPATAVAVQDGLGIHHGAAFDLQAVCSGFVFALATADNFIRTGSFKRALVIGAETFSRILDWSDRGTCVLFGDGAGAVVLDAQSQPGLASDRGVLTTHLRSDGRHKSKLYVDGGPSSTRTVGYLRMEGREVFKHAVYPPPGQQANHRRFGPQAAYCAAEGGAHGRSAWQYIGGIDPAGAFGCGRRRACEERRSGAARSHGGWLYLGFGAGPLVSRTQKSIIILPAYSC
jgi:3-oxoacyl-[acyl-carrier-protein] synthase-3